MLTRHAVARRTLLAHRLASNRPPCIPSRCGASQLCVPDKSRRLLVAESELRPGRRRAARALLAVHSQRHLATALDDFRQTADIPFENLPRGLRTTYPNASHQPAYELRPFDTSFPLVVKDSPPKAPRQRINVSGIPGDVEEMISVFNACLQVGKLERAELVLKRFANMGSLGSGDLMALHNQYLRAKLESIAASPELNKAEDVHMWYELQIRSQDLPQTAETIACMVKASLLTTYGSRLERLVNRYMGMVSGDTGLEVLYMSDILTDQDIATVTELCPTYNFLQVNEDSALPSEDANAASYEAVRIDGQTSADNPAPEVLSTPQKGVGLKVLKQTLSLFSEIPSGSDISQLPHSERHEIQARLERDCVAAAVEKWREENQQLLKMGLNTSLSAASLNSRLYDWHRDLEKRLTKEISMTDAAEAAERKSADDLDRCVYGPFLRQSSPSRLAAVTILSTLSSLAMAGADKGVPLSAVINQLSKVVEQDIQAQQREKEAAKALTGAKRRKVKRMTKTADDNGQLQVNLDHAGKAQDASVQVSTPNVVENADYKNQSWPVVIRTKVGAALLSALIKSAKINVVKEDPDSKQLIAQLQPAFSHANQLRRGKKVGMILPNRTLVELMKREPKGAFLARHLPMVVEPEPWSKFDKGGYLESPTHLVRTKPGEKDQRIYTEAALARGDMEQVLKGLDVLGRTAWRINQPVFDVMLEAWNTGEAIADIPPLHPNIAIPPEPASSADPTQRSSWVKAVKAAENEKSGLHSVRCFINFQLEIARAFRDQVFYFPHNIDFRGRAYPIPTYLNHMGADHVRGLMSFATGKELGSRGLQWLRVHLANVYGYDKASLADREAFATQNMSNIIDSANNPLDGKRWWLEAEDPWQCLAACYELKAALESPDPERFISHLPVHQDGTCNGLQHYAALGGDTWGAKQVNLEPGEKPADVYTAVANLVKESMAKDLEQDNPFAKALVGKVTRKVVKQTVMTNVYGVTFAGAKKQVLKQLDALYPDLHKESGFDPHLLSSYIATLIFRAMSTMFRGAHDIQYWLGEIGSRVCRALTPEQLSRIASDLPMEKKARGAKSKVKTSTDELLGQFRSTIVWTTPLRMPVVQPYRKSGTRIISTCLQNLVLSMPEPSDPVHRRKQLQAFPPNFIHSLDASHMILCALECEDRGLTFAAVHDSFWTHAGDIDTMNNVLRDSFIRIHSEDVIGRLAGEFEARYKGSIYLAKMNKGTEVEKKITAHRKRVSLSLKDELLLEKKRLDLLRSSDPLDVEKGKKMVTPASIFEDMSKDDDSLTESEDLEEFALGSIPAEEAAPLASAGARAAVAVAGDATEVDSEAEADALSDDSVESVDTRLQSLIGTTHFELQVTKPRSPRPQNKTIQIWVPLTFPKIPEKGSFDVRRLKSSAYFFS